MSPDPTDPRWPRLLGLSVHELRAPMTVVAGYIRMLLKDRAGPLADPQRRLLEEAEKSCARLSALLVEMSDLANLESSTATFNRSPLDLRAVLTQVVTALPPMPDREVQVTLTTEDTGAAMVTGDAVRLKTALTSLLVALRRELVTTTELFVRERTVDIDGTPSARLTIGDVEQIDALSVAGPADLTIFDEWRGGCGLSLAVARRIITQHGGDIWSPGTGAKAGAVIVLPLT